MTFHSELRDALFASGLPFLLSINDVLGAEQGRLHHKAVLEQERLQARAASAASGQSCCTTGLPGPRQARTRPQSDFGLERGYFS